MSKYKDPTPEEQASYKKYLKSREIKSIGAVVLGMFIWWSEINLVEGDLPALVMIFAYFSIIIAVVFFGTVRCPKCKRIAIKSPKCSVCKYKL